MSEPEEDPGGGVLDTSQPPPLQLVFGVDEEGSEASVTSPCVTEEESSNPLTGYLPPGSSNESSVHIDGEPLLPGDQTENSGAVTSDLSSPEISANEKSEDSSRQGSVANVTENGLHLNVSQEGLQTKRTEGDVGANEKIDGSPGQVANVTEDSLRLNVSEEGLQTRRTQDGHSKSDEESSHHNETPPISPSVSLPANLFKSQPQDSVFFSGVRYLGSSTVDAPVSETEANRKMSVLKTQAGQPIPIILQIPHNNCGNIMLKDPSTNQILTAFPIRHVLFCARGDTDSNLNDCLALNVVHKRSGVYHCHVFLCEIPEACEKVFYAIGKAFKQKAGTPDMSSSHLNFELDVSVEIQEEDPKGNYNSVTVDKDCFRLRPHAKKRIVFTVSQSIQGNAKPLPFERCFGLLLAVGKDVKRNDMHLLDNMNTTSSGSTDSTSFIVSGYWDTDLPFLRPLAEEQPKSAKNHYLTVAADLVAEGIVEPLRFSRVLRVKVGKTDSFGSIISTLTRRKLPVMTFILSLERKPSLTVGKSVQYIVKSLKPAAAGNSLNTSPPLNKEKMEVGKAADECSTPSPLLRKLSGRTREADNPEDSDNSQTGDDLEESDIVVSGWGDDETDLRDDLLQQWSEMLDRWDGRDKWDPHGDKPRSKTLCKLVRNGIPGPLRCQIWQMLSGADNDPQLLEAYRLLVTKESPNENVITWDIKRTFVGHEFFQDGLGGREALYKISKAYSIYDQEVGYCQGFSFMAAVLLLQKMPEEQAFAVLVKIMFSYGHRNVFRLNFKELHLMFYQLQRLVDENLHELHEHFMSKSIETHMYASQWFLTIFTAKFPLNVTYQIMDMYLCEGTSIVFQVALALLKMTQHELLNMDFEGILNYFRATLPKRFGSEEEAKNLFKTAKSFQKITQRKLKKLEKDYQMYLDQQALLEDPSVRIERENKQLQETVLRLQRENDDLAEELVGSKVLLRAEMDKLEERIDTLSKESRASKSSLDAANLLIKELKEELQHAKDTYQKAMLQLAEERQQHESAITEYKQLFQQLDEGHQKQKEDLSQELLEVKAQLGTQTGEGDHQASLTSEQRLRQVELELAQTKLALVEAQCKNQELEHNVEELRSQTKGKPSWLPRFN